MLKVVVDANVFISALINPGTAAKLLAELRRDQFLLIYPACLTAEIKEIMHKPKLSRLIENDDVVELLEFIADKGILVEPADVPKVCRDPEDDVYLACAVAGRADFIVTGDHDLLSLSQHGPIKIVMPGVS